MAYPWLRVTLAHLCSLHSFSLCGVGAAEEQFSGFFGLHNFEDCSSVLQTTSLLHVLALHCTHLCCTFVVVLHHCCSELRTCAGRRFASVSQSLASPLQRLLSGSELLDPTQASISRRLAGRSCVRYSRPYAVCPWPCAVASVLGPLPGTRACHLSFSSSFAEL